MRTVASRTELSEADWAQLKARFAPREAWLAAKPATAKPAPSPAGAKGRSPSTVRRQLGQAERDLATATERRDDARHWGMHRTPSVDYAICLDGKRILVTGVLTDQSIAFQVARIAQEQGATVVLSSFGRTMNLTRRSAGRLPQPAPIVELDVTNDEDLAALAERVREHVDGLDGVLHSIGFAPEAALGGNFLNTAWPDVATALQVSAYSLKSLAMAARSSATAR